MASIRDDVLPEEVGISSTERRPAGEGVAQGVPGNPLVTEALLRALPKVDLHCHLDGSLRLETILELARIQGLALPADDVEGLARAIHKGEVCRSLEEYLVAFDVTLAVLQTAPALERAAYELAVDAASENVRWLEVRYSPALHLQKGLKMTEVVDAVLEGLRRAERETGIRCGVIICGIRHISPQTSVRLAELCVAYKNRGVVGFDSAGAEMNFPAKDHKQAFHLILKNNVNCTAHAGEGFGPESISQALHNLGAHRIGHGVRLREDGDLLNYVNDHRIPLESCPSSNLQTGAVDALANHPLKFYLDYGLRVTINTDNRLITDTTITKELLVAHRELGLSLDEICEVLLMGFESAFLPWREKTEVLRQARQEMEDVRRRFAVRA